MHVRHRLSVTIFLFLAALFCSVPAFSQTEAAAISGRVADPQGLAVAGAKVSATSTSTNVTTSTHTNGAGFYNLPSLIPGTYRVIVEKEGFAQIIKPDVQLHVQDNAGINFSLQVGSITQSVTVEGGAPLVNTTDASVSTVVDRQFAENLPMNGRSFQTLIELTPGVVLTPLKVEGDGQFSVNGQRANSNYWMVDGVSANISVNPSFSQGAGAAGAVGSFTAQGGTNSLVSVDALQEFRIQTSTYAPEFGRTPGGQISIVTRSGTNAFHGTAFDYFRNGVLDASNWFNGYTNNPPLPKPEERQNDFGGTFSGPILKNKTFFFFSYEGLRLGLPQTTLTTVPDFLARQNALPALQPYLNAYPKPNGADNVGTGIAEFNSSYLSSANLDSYGIRIDHKFKDTLSIFGRYSYSASDTIGRGPGGGNDLFALSVVTPSHINTQTGTIGATWIISSTSTNDLRFNYSRVNANSYSYLDSFGGAVPLTSLPFPSPYSSQNAFLDFRPTSLAQPELAAGKLQRNLLRQINIVDNVSVQRGSHALKFGVDYRRLSPVGNPYLYGQHAFFPDVPSAETGTTSFHFIIAQRGATLLLQNLGVFVQDTWRIVPRLTMTYGLRWDVDFAPSSLSGPSLSAVTGFNLNDLSTLRLAPAGTTPFGTTFSNVAPRIGLAYQVSQNGKWQTVLRGGFGVFYDLTTSEVGNLLSGFYPYDVSNFGFGATFPLDSATSAPPTFAEPGGGLGTIAAFDPHLKSPYTLEWNIALEQAMGEGQVLSASYVGASGRRLIQTASVFPPNPNYAGANIVTNAGTSSYNALQLELRRRLAHGLQALFSYTWSHSIDTGSAGSVGSGSDALIPSFKGNRGPSDFDIRNAFSGGLTYDIPAVRKNLLAKAILSGWSTQSFVIARSAPPVDIFNSASPGLTTGFFTNTRPDVLPGIPLYLYGSQYPGGKVINNTLGAVVGGCPDGSQSIGPFCPPPTDPNTGLPSRQGNLQRNALRAFGAVQWDFAIHRDFPIHERVKLQFRAEMFNVLNHPNFGPPTADLSSPQFGLSTQMLGQSLAGGLSGSGALDPLYQLGGPRSIQFALKLVF